MFKRATVEFLSKTLKHHLFTMMHYGRLYGMVGLGYTSVA